MGSSSLSTLLGALRGTNVGVQSKLAESQRQRELADEEARRRAAAEEKCGRIAKLEQAVRDSGADPDVIRENVRGMTARQVESDLPTVRIHRERWPGMR